MHVLLQSFESFASSWWKSCGIITISDNPKTHWKSLPGKYPHSSWYSSHTSVSCKRKLIESNKGAESCLSITHEPVNQTLVEGEFEDKVNLIVVSEFLRLVFPFNIRFWTLKSSSFNPPLLVRVTSDLYLTTSLQSLFHCWSLYVHFWFSVAILRTSELVLPTNPQTFPQPLLEDL